MDQACKGCLRKAEGTDCDPKSFCKCTRVIEVSRKSFAELAIDQLGKLLEDHRNGDDSLNYQNLVAIYEEGKRK